MEIRKIRIVGRHIVDGGTKSEHITAYKLELPAELDRVFVATKTRWRIASRTEAVGWLMNPGSYTSHQADGSETSMQIEYHVDNGGRHVAAGERHHEGVGVKTAANGWLQTYSDGYWNDNLYALPQCPDQD